MATATEHRRSPPFPTADDSLDLSFEVAPPLRLQGDTIDASRLESHETAEVQIGGRLDIESLRTRTQIEGNVTVVVVLRCAATRWSNTFPVEMEESTDGSFVLSSRIQLNPASVRGSADGEVVVLLAVDRESQAGGAKRRGSVLARKTFRIQFDKGGFEFPTEWVSFRLYGYPDKALWHVFLGAEEWTGTASEVVAIHLNGDQKELQRLIQTPRPPERVARDILLRMIAYDSVAQLLATYLSGPGCESAVEMEGDKLCDVLERLIERQFPEPREQLRELARESPLEFWPRVQAAVGLGRLQG